MNFTIFINRTLEFSVIILGIALCLMPVTDYLKVSPKKFYPILTAAVFIICPAVGALFAVTDSVTNNALFPVMFLCLFLYFSFVNLDKPKLLYLFLCAVAMLSFGGIAGEITDAVIYPNGLPEQLATVGLLVQYLISALSLCLFYATRKKIIWLFENFHSTPVWLMVCIIPTIISFCNVMMLPENYAVVSVGRILFLYCIIDISLFLLFVISQIMFYYVAKTATEKQLADQKILLYQMQAAWYEALNDYMEHTKRLRHDFRHIIVTVGELISSKQFGNLEQYYNDYLAAYPAPIPPHYFCSSATLNALLSHYANIASDSGIDTDFRIQLPDTEKISDIDFSILFGNLLENAIFACKAAAPSDRYIHLTADMDTPGSLYITMANGFDGFAKKQNGSFLSTKKNGNAIGLASIRTIAEKYQGTAKFYYKNKEFISNIMIKI